MSEAARVFDLAEVSRRELNQALHDAPDGEAFEIVNPRGAHAVACGITANIDVVVRGSVGYYCAGMHQRGRVLVEGNASTGLAENIMSGAVHITGNATMSAGATGCGGLVVVGGNAGARCGISMKGADIVVGGNVGHMSAFMAQAGNLAVCGDAAADLGDSIYEAQIFVRGDVESLGADCVEKEMRPEHLDLVGRLLAAAGGAADGAAPRDFRRYGSARRLYNFTIDDVDALAAAEAGPGAEAGQEAGQEAER
ncbi:hypothetical protein [Candidatus Poriferisodalis sp.]|uniref:hypothetical protein n=1 Tax=Candidatus Poriferisodalis sp. TaxID=3101277 RepID=UPI003B018DB3